MQPHSVLPARVRRADAFCCGCVAGTRRRAQHRVRSQHSALQRRLYANAMHMRTLPAHTPACICDSLQLQQPASTEYCNRLLSSNMSKAFGNRDHRRAEGGSAHAATIIRSRPSLRPRSQTHTPRKRDTTAHTALASDTACAGARYMHAALASDTQARMRTTDPEPHTCPKHTRIQHATAPPPPGGHPAMEHTNTHACTG